jgi:alpha-L-rhamnosidase
MFLSLQLPEFAWKTDSYTALRGQFILEREQACRLHMVGASWFQVWLDGRWIAEGPARFVVGKPEVETFSLTIPAGRHVLAVVLNHLDVETRLLKKMEPFLDVHLEMIEGKAVELSWKAAPLEGYRPAMRRINPQLGWCEWCDTRLNPTGWQELGFADDSWTVVEPQARTMQFSPLRLKAVQQFSHELTAVAEGQWVDRFGYESDDPPVRFFLRDLASRDLPPQGVWRRFDLGRVRLGRAQVTLDVPVGTVVELAYSETLCEGRVSPFINLSCGTSCNLDHYVARGGVQEFGPLTPRGGRYLEVHVYGSEAAIRWVGVRFQERCYHGPAEGGFTCDDVLLNRIWAVGVETYRACAEDAVIDNPTRERGQWTGDVVSVGLDIASVAYGDLRLLRRGLIQSAQSAKETGLVAGLCPGGDVFLGSYAAQWTTACVQYYRATGDLTLLEEGLPYAIRNLEAFDPFLKEAGLEDGIDWPFIDWGYVKKAGEIDLGMNVHLLLAYRSFLGWCDYLKNTEARPKVAAQETSLTQLLKNVVADKIKDGFEALGYHGTVLVLTADLVPKQKRREGVDFIKAHILRCFPNNPDAPRLSDPSANHEQLITPYFAHYAFDLLIAEGEMNFVLEQYRKCWGWMLEQQSGTWLEVFDVRWSHCHQWAGCPTWQLSRYGLGLRPRWDRGEGCYDFCLRPGDLCGAKGKLPVIGCSATIMIEWKRVGAKIHYKIITPRPIQVLGVPDQTGELFIDSIWKGEMRIQGIEVTAQS